MTRGYVIAGNSIWRRKCLFFLVRYHNLPIPAQSLSYPRRSSPVLRNFPQLLLQRPLQLPSIVLIPIILHHPIHLSFYLFLKRGQSQHECAGRVDPKTSDSDASQVSKTQVMVRAAMVSTIYRKTLRARASTANSAGNTINLMSTDCDRIANFCPRHVPS